LAKECAYVVSLPERPAHMRQLWQKIAHMRQLCQKEPRTCGGFGNALPKLPHVCIPEQHLRLASFQNLLKFPGQKT